MTVVAYPKAAESTVINANAPNAPANTVIREYFIAIMAAIKNVLSPSSDTIITETDATKPWINP